MSDMQSWSGPAVCMDNLNNLLPRLTHDAAKVATKSRSGAIVVGNVLSQVFASTFIIARIISKAFIRRRWGADDTMLCVAWTLSIALTILACLLTRYGSGIHISELPASALVMNRKLDYASLLLYNPTLSLTKLAICLFYLSIFADPLNRRLTKAALAFILAYTVPLEAAWALQCWPLAGIWDRARHPDAVCVDTMPHFYVTAACSMAADAWLVALVVPSILPLQIPRRQKVVLLGVVSLGWLVIVACIVRVLRIRAVADTADFTWASYDIAVWSAVEVDAGLLCAAAPATKPLFKAIAPAFLRSRTRDPGDRGSSSPSSSAGAGGATSPLGSDVVWIHLPGRDYAQKVPNRLRLSIRSIPLFCAIKSPLRPRIH
ncbi:hypothetical protein B0J12DRAFT_790932 [Macrophomina phaseolina]|uniref:Rhodopsin domain-containing protein n=1 Tax=Macrophomina phaseolina TaxID=35725 RepID=A0ABQ8FQD6_9PEZI|nr:hypothetical protein B0J12DRAFT_790932 [Macrophomina phaseolina]